jgi:hypothetical protein
VTIVKAIEAHVRQQAKQRQVQAGKKHGRGKIASGNLPEAVKPQPQTRDIAAAYAGMSGRTYERADADEKISVCDAIEA